MESWLPENFNQFVSELNPGEEQKYIVNSYPIQNGIGRINQNRCYKKQNGDYILLAGYLKGTDMKDDKAEDKAWDKLFYFVDYIRGF